MIRAIETIYNGYRFRSRLEARWAVFFDTLGIRYEYEPEGYVLSTGVKYLPDFWLPTFSCGMFVEVKPHGGDFSKAKQFAEELPATIWLAEGDPRPIWYTVGYPEYGRLECIKCDEIWMRDDHNNQTRDCDKCTESTTWGLTSYIWEAGAPLYLDAHDEDRMYWDWCGGHEFGEELDYPEDKLIVACTAARQARFEYGENGTHR